MSLYIDGEIIYETRDSYSVTNPATGEELGKLPLAAAADLDRSLQAAASAWGKWRHTPAVERSDILRRAAALVRDNVGAIAAGITLDQGKPLAEARAEVLNGAEHFEWHAEEARRIYGRIIPARSNGSTFEVLREPVGVCAAFTPWNFPFSQAVKKIAAALGSGCTLILKGPEEAPSAISALAGIFHEAGLPAGVLNIVWGNPAEVSEHLIKSPVVKKISFTGSVPVGRLLAERAGKYLKRVTLELGGHAPVLVFNDADVARAAAGLAKAKMRNAGQVCVSPCRFYVQEQVYEHFVDVFTATAESITVGNGLDPDTVMGPLFNQKRLEAALGFVGNAISLGGKVLTGGKRLTGGDFDKGFFFPPTVLADLPSAARILREEPFCPVAPVIRFRKAEDALTEANSLPYGLAAYVFTESLKTADLVSRGLDSGLVGINQFSVSQAETPFGGVNDSGIGSEGGKETFDGYLRTKFIART
ncbi:NAD-dependent succinate-semialdehyde dehydrogenase [Brenneria tiliae]|uniref:NAD-dependent succinate-semialdehyde dehydrogenase n=1 Tax=Brenneria tiliae TaxID=2914984 RepID=UPI002014E4BA|nr:NAD-dependent succinate-semialdehyde dehydrogenase [Brenneria tiliae]MCL2898407.1 NAD-dependent succinate-semialdehyde dehydrogenase [Brenneria tiliae]MCL2903051.1 NAD-dependent succinate-semialdehyde dehydrogenase [Brenneria tiliae]